MNIVKLVGPVCIIFVLLFGLVGCSSDRVDETPEEAKTIETGSAPPKQTTTLAPVASVNKEPSEVKKTAPAATPNSLVKATPVIATVLPFSTRSSAHYEAYPDKDVIPDGNLITGYRNNLNCRIRSSTYIFTTWVCCQI